jgi:3-oxoacyl-[acyl-carrier-protein] synthase II
MADGRDRRDRRDRRVAVTGIGLICALGGDRETVWARMLEGACGIGPVTLFETAGFRSQIAAEVDLTDRLGSLTPYERRRWSRSDQLAVLAAGEALADAGLLDSAVDRTRVGVLLGAGTGDLLRNEDYLFTYLGEGIDRTRPTEIFHHFSNIPVDIVASKFDLTGLRACFVSACSSSTIAIGHAADAIADGQLDAAVCGGADALARLTFSGFNALRLMDPSPCRPFDVTRAGMNIGEGAAILVLEELERAQRRGAPIYAELAGYGLGCEAYHPTAPEPEGLAVARTIRAALDSAGVNPDEVGHVNCHGTATPQNDKAEAKSLHVVFGDRARRIPANSIKSMIGHCLGTAGAMEAATLALTLARGVIPPTINHGATDPDCPLDIVANQPRETAVSCGISTSLAFGGNDSVLVMRRL